MRYINNPKVSNFSTHFRPIFDSDSRNPTMSQNVSPVGESDTAEPGRRTRRKDARPGELVTAALDLFVERGFSATRVEDVAARAGVSKGTLFLYFPTKSDLFKAVVRDSIVGRLNEFAKQIAAFQGPTGELMLFAMNSWWEQVGSAKAGGISKLMMSEAGNFPELAQFYVEEVIHPSHRLIESIVLRGVERGEFRDVDVLLTAQAMIAPMMHLICWKHSFATMPCNAYQLEPHRYIRVQVDLLLNGLSAPGSHPT